MGAPELDRLDWNLIPALNALLLERNVSRAARRIGTSQSAASGSLARLRRFFGDELLVRRGHRYELTPLAEQLLPLATAAVSSTRSLVGSRAVFDPAVSTRQFTVLMSDYTQLVLGPALAQAVSAEAPNAQVLWQAPATAAAEAEEGQSAIGDPHHVLADVDGWIVPRDQIQGLPATGRLLETWTCIAAVDHPHLGDTLTRDDLARFPWVSFTIPGLGRVPRLRPLLVHGIEPRIEVVTDSFASIPFLVAGTTRLALVQTRLALRLADVAGVRLLEPPVSIPPLHLTMLWHPDLTSDLGHRWFRRLVESTLASLDAQPPPVGA